MNDETVRTKIEQGRAAFAHQLAVEGKPLGDKYKSQVKKIPMMIKTNGLGAALAFIYSKKDKEGGVYKKLGDQIAEWINLDDKYIRYTGGQRLENYADLVERVTKIDSQQYRALTVEILALFNWLRRFAEGMIGGEGDNG